MIEKFDRIERFFALESIESEAQPWTMSQTWPSTLCDSPTAPAAGDPWRRGRQRLGRVVPGTLLCIGVSVLAIALQAAEARLFGRAWLEALVLAILLGTLIRSLWTPPSALAPGIGFSAKLPLEIAVMLLGATVSVRAIIGVGPALLAGIALIVPLSIVASYAIGRAFGLPPRMAVLIGCGNAICGNSAIAAVAPVIGARPGDVAAAIAFTAVLGVAVVLGLPLLAIAAHMHAYDFGILAGLTVYAVPQVLAATAPISSLSAQVGTLVKLVRVLMLGPVVMTLSLLMRGRQPRQPDTGTAGARARPTLATLLPWFIAGFLALLAVRSAGLLPASAIAPIGGVAGALTIVSMAALGLGVDVRALAKAGTKVASVVTLSLLLLGLMAALLVWIL